MNREDKIKALIKYCKNSTCDFDCEIRHLCTEHSCDAETYFNKWGDKNIETACDAIRYFIISCCESAKNMPDTVNHPAHYETGKYNCIDVMIETQGADTVANFCICNAFKYLYRWKNKNGIEDIKKAQWYIGKFLELQDQLEDK